MSMSRHAVLCAGLLVIPVAAADETPRLGEALDAHSLADLDYTVLPNGDGLPAGSGTAADGALVYRAHCLGCHGEAGSGGVNDTLVGGHGSLATENPIKTVGSYWPYATTLFDYVRRAMPYQTPGVLTNDEIYAVTAYVLFLNGIVAEDERLTAESLPDVLMPNRDGFVWDHVPE